MQVSIAVTTKKMFGTPERVTRNGTAMFFVPLSTPAALGLELFLKDDAELPTPDLSHQSKFETLQEKLLQELTKHKTIFKTQPSYESLKGICPNWGLVLNNGIASWSPYTNVDSSSITQKPAKVDLALRGIYISRSTISPLFSCMYLGPVTDTAVNDDLEWDETVGASEISEVYDIPSESGTIMIKDPAALQREKLAEKERVREAFRIAAEARAAAERAEEQFYEKYELSDSESAFTDYASDRSAEDD